MEPQQTRLINKPAFILLCRRAGRFTSRRHRGNNRIGFTIFLAKVVFNDSKKEGGLLRENFLKCLNVQIYIYYACQASAEVLSCTTQASACSSKERLCQGHKRS